MECEVVGGRMRSSLRVVLVVVQESEKFEGSELKVAGKIEVQQKLGAGRSQFFSTVQLSEATEFSEPDEPDEMDFEWSALPRLQPCCNVTVTNVTAC